MGVISQFISGAENIISIIRGRKSVTELLLGNNALMDDGCEYLFDFLCSEEGRQHEIFGINLACNKIGDRGLQALSRYLYGNTALRELYLEGVSIA